MFKASWSFTLGPILGSFRPYWPYCLSRFGNVVFAKDLLRISGPHLSLKWSSFLFDVITRLDARGPRCCSKVYTTPRKWWLELLLGAQETQVGSDLFRNVVAFCLFSSGLGIRRLIWPGHDEVLIKWVQKLKENLNLWDPSMDKNYVSAVGLELK